MGDREAKAVKAIKMTSKCFFTYAKKQSKMKPALGPLESGGRVLSDAGEVASELNNYYSVIYTHPFSKMSTPPLKIEMDQIERIPCKN